MALTIAQIREAESDEVLLLLLQAELKALFSRELRSDNLVFFRVFSRRLRD